MKLLLPLVFTFAFCCGLHAGQPCDSLIVVPGTFDISRQADSTRFKPQLTNGFPEHYDFEIRTTGGQVVFRTDIPQQGWNGRLNNRGNICGNGIYWWTISMRVENDSNEYICKGQVNCINAHSGVRITALDTLACKPILYFPSHFVPNGDGLHDEFVPTYGCVPVQYQLDVYDRWGNLVFRSQDVSQGWNGNTPDGNYAAGEVYVWRCICRFYEGDKQHDVTGQVALIR